MAKPENPFFSKALVNRLWGHFYGRGLVHQMDDLRETNPPSNPELLDALAKEFRDHKFDMKHMIRLMVQSQTYQLSSEPTDDNRSDVQNFARFYGRRLPAEVAHDAVEQATGYKTNFGNMSANSRAIDLPHASQRMRVRTLDQRHLVASAAAVELRRSRTEAAERQCSHRQDVRSETLYPSND
jgi:hypothetical protein